MFSCCAEPNFYRCRRRRRHRRRWSAVVENGCPRRASYCTVARRRNRYSPRLLAVPHSRRFLPRAATGLFLFFALPGTSTVVTAVFVVYCYPSPSSFVDTRRRLLLPVAVVGTRVIVVLYHHRRGTRPFPGERRKYLSRFMLCGGTVAIEYRAPSEHSECALMNCEL